MPIAQMRDLRVDQLLTNMSIGYKNLGYIADTIAPIVPVKHQTGLIPRFKKSHWFRNEAKLRAMGSRSEGGGWDVDSSLEYYCPRYSFRDELPDELIDNADSVYDLEANSVDFVVDKLQMKREISLASNYFGASKGWTDKTGGVDYEQWSDYANSTPLIDSTVIMDAVEMKIGREANTLVIGKEVWNSLRWHPDLIETIKYTQMGVVSETLAANLLGVSRLIVGKGIYTTSPEGTAEASVVYQRIWGKGALYLYLTSAPALNNPAAMYTLVWNRVPNAIQYIKRMRDEEREIDIIEGNTYFTHKLTAGDAGLFVASAVA